MKKTLVIFELHKKPSMINIALTFFSCTKQMRLILRGALLLLATPLWVKSQNNPSPLETKSSCTTDSCRINSWIEKGKAYLGTQLDSAEFYSLKAYEESVRTGRSRERGLAAKNLGSVHYLRGQYYKSVVFQQEALNVFDSLIAVTKDSVASASYLKTKSLVLSNMGSVFQKQGVSFSKALEYYFAALKIADKLNDQKAQALLYGNLGNFYNLNGKKKEALSYYVQALEMKRVFKDTLGFIHVSTNITNLYIQLGDTAMARKYLIKAFEIAKRTGSPQLLATTHEQLADLCFLKKDYSSALKYFSISLEISEQAGYADKVATVTGNIGQIYKVMGDKKTARKFLENASDLSSRLNLWQNVTIFEKDLYEIDSSEQKAQAALFHYKKYIQARDSVTNNENTRSQIQHEMQYEFDKKMVTDSVKNAENLNQEKLKHDQEIAQHRTYTYGGIIGFILMMAVAGISFRAYRNKQKANKIIEHQKKLVEEKQKEILDSIRYARRIQRSLITNSKYIEKNLERLQKATKQ